MSCRSNFSGRWQQDHRNKGRPTNIRKNFPLKSKSKASKEFFSKSLICNRKQFIRLFCPHCHTRCLTFMDYKKHLHADKHLRAINRRIQITEREIEHKRKEQQLAQTTADKAAKMLGTSSAVVKYCAVCDVYFYQEESKHIASKLHNILQKLLEPVCKICTYTAKDTVDYENHLCSLDHLKKEEGWTGESEESSPNISGESSPSKEGTKKTPDSESGSGPSVDPDKPGGLIQKVEALFCSVCKEYFSCTGGQDAALAKHCASNDHLRKWAEYVEEKHQKEMSSKE